jgi:hypothetical protein
VSNWNDPAVVVDVAREIDRYFDDSSLVEKREPEVVLLIGPVAVGKTRYRRKNYKSGYVLLDAGDIFIRLSRGRYIAFPSFLAKPMDAIGAAIAQRAVRERRRIVTEMIGTELEPVQLVIETMKASGYRVSIKAMTVDFELSAIWNQSRSNSNISAYYSERYHVKWLLDACEVRS